MIDLRSDTLTKPTEEMRKAMYEAEVGDEGRMDASGKGEDPTVNRLEDIAAQLTGKEDAMFVPSGTMGNLAALMTYCSAGQRVGVEKKIHIYHNEKAAFSERPGGLIPEFFETDQQSHPKPESIKAILDQKKIALLCLENSHNYGGGHCLTGEETNFICSLAKKSGVAVHLDGARINNAAIYLDTPVDELVAMVDTVMFCLSKGLGAPVGSMLCGSHDFIVEARRTRKSLGGTMRQAGVLAAAGIVAIEHERDRLIEDHQNARLLAVSVAQNPKIKINMEEVQTNIVRLDVSPSGHDAQTFQEALESRGLKAKAVSEKLIRMVTYREIGKEDILLAAQIINECCKAL
jgi:threonine aldolase